MADNRAAAKGLASLSAVVALSLPFVARWEGQRNDPYKDVGGLLTVCYGETHAVEQRHYSDAECKTLLANSLTEHTREVRACIPAATPLETQAAFGSFGYNVGTPQACRSTAVKRLWAGDVAGACQAMMGWVYVHGKRSQGLANRRTAERALCLQGIRA